MDPALLGLDLPEGLSVEFDSRCLLHGLEQCADCERRWSPPQTTAADAAKIARLFGVDESYLGLTPNTQGAEN